MPVILALDLGFACLGWAAIDVAPATPTVIAAGVVRTKKSAKKRGVRVADDDCDRCAHQARALDALLLDHRPVCAVAEVPHGGAKSSRACRSMALGTGIAVAVLAVRGVPCIWTTPRAGKLAATGNAGASKLDVEAGVMRHLPSARAALDAAKRADREHIADACAAYLAAQHDPLVQMARGLDMVRGDG